MPRRADGTLIGCEEPRLWTRPLVELDERTSLGPACIRFAEDVCGYELFPAQKWLLLHLLELRAPYDDRAALRYRTALVLMGRQNSKSTVAKIVALFLMYVVGVRLVLGTAQNLAIATEVWESAVALAESCPELAAEVANIRRANGQQSLTLASGSRYMVAATAQGAGRGLSVSVLLADELREQRDWLAYAALSKTLIAQKNGILIGLSSAGSDQSVVLNALRENALSGSEESVGIFEYSAEEGCQLDDTEAWAQSNPGLGWTITEAAIRSALATDPPAIFRVETLTQRVSSMSSAIDMNAWAACLDPSANLEKLKARVALCVDVSVDNAHVTLVAAAVGDDGRVVVEAVAAWTSPVDARRDLPGWLERVKPRAFGWFPGGPGAALAADLRSDVAQELRGAAVTESCLGFAEQVASLSVRHAGDALLTTHVGHAERMKQGDAWRFCRPREGHHIDAAYAAAGAVHLARTLPPANQWTGPLVI